MSRLIIFLLLMPLFSSGCFFFKKGALPPPGPGGKPAYQPPPGFKPWTADYPPAGVKPPDDFLDLEFTQGGAQNLNSCYKLKDLIHHRKHKGSGLVHSSNYMLWEKVSEGIWYFYDIHMDNSVPRHVSKHLLVKQNGRVHPAGGTWKFTPRYQEPHSQGVFEPEKQAEAFAQITQALKKSRVNPSIHPLPNCTPVPVALVVPPGGFVPQAAQSATGPEALVRRKQQAAANGGWTKPLDKDFVTAVEKICNKSMGGRDDRMAASSCLEPLAKASGDVQVCELYNVWKAPGMHKCIISALGALGKGGYDCFALKEDQMIRDCLQAKVDTGDKQACEDLTLATGSDKATVECREYMAPQTREECLKLTKWSLVCLKQLAFRTRDGQLCENFQNGQHGHVPRRDCFQRMALLTRNISLCKEAEPNCEGAIDFLIGKYQPLLHYNPGLQYQNPAPEQSVWGKPVVCTPMPADHTVQCEMLRKYWDRLHGGTEVVAKLPATAIPPPRAAQTITTYDAQMKELAESPKGVGPDGTIEMGDGRIFFLSQPPADRRAFKAWDAFAAIFDSESNKWIKSERFSIGIRPAVTDLNNGKILVIGGMSLTDQSVAHGILIDGSLKKIEVAPPLPEPVQNGMIVTLQSGQALLAGGIKEKADYAAKASASAFLFKDGRWTAVKPMKTARTGGIAVKLKDGRVLVAGGSELAKGATPSAGAEIFDPTTGDWTAAQSMIRKRFGAVAMRLDDGRVLVVGGGEGSEIFNSVKNEWIEGPVPLDTRTGGFAVPLEDGRVAVLGGEQNKGFVEIMDADKRVSVYSGSISNYFSKDRRRLHLTGAVPDPLGRVLVTLSDPAGDVMRPYMYFPTK